MDPSNASTPDVNNGGVADQGAAAPVSAPDVVGAPVPEPTDVDSAPTPPVHTEPAAPAPEAPPTSEPTPAPADSGAPAMATPAPLPVAHKKSPIMLIGLVGLVVIALAVVAYFALAS